MLHPNAEGAAQIAKLGESAVCRSLDPSANSPHGRSDIQYVLFNLVALAFFWGEFMRVPTKALPTIPDVLLGLTSVAAAGYVGKKALASAPAITAVLPKDSGRVGQILRLFSSGVAKPGDDTTVITIRLGEAVFSPVALSATTTQGTILEGPIPADAAGAVELSVTSPTGKKSVWPNKYRIEPTIAIPAGAAPAQPGHSYILETTGVVPPGPAFSNVKVTVAGIAIPPALDEGRLSVCRSRPNWPVIRGAPGDPLRRARNPSPSGESRFACLNHAPAIASLLRSALSSLGRLLACGCRRRTIKRPSQLGQ